MKHILLITVLLLSACARFTGSDPESTWQDAQEFGTTKTRVSMSEGQTVAFHDYGFSLTFEGVADDTRCRADRPCEPQAPYEEQRRVIVLIRFRSLNQNHPQDLILALYRYTDYATPHAFWFYPPDHADQPLAGTLQLMDIDPRLPHDGMGPSRIDIRLSDTGG